MPKFNIVVYGIILILILIYVLIKIRLLYWHRRGIPYIEPYPLFGNMRGVLNNLHITEAFGSVYRQFKSLAPFCGFYFLMEPTVLIMDLNLVRNILIKDFNNFENRGTYYNEKDDPLTGHLFNLEAEAWRKLRNKLSTTFTSGKMKLMFPMICKIGEECSSTLEILLENTSEIDVKELMARYTTDVIGSCVFGLDCNSLKNPNAEFRNINKNLFATTRHYRFVYLLMRLMPKLAKTLRMKELLDETHNFYFKIVKETIEYREKYNIIRNDYLNLLMEMKNSKDSEKSLNMNEVTANAFAFFLAGFETSATTMTFALYELAINLEIQDTLRQEILQVLKKYNNELTYNAIQEMQYLKKVLKETLRKYPVLPFLQRKAKNDYVTQTPGYIIPKNILAIISIYAIHYDPENFPQPHKFLPERFDAHETEIRHPLAWIPFGAGPRNCIGLRFGELQSYVGLVSILRYFTVSVCEKTPIPIDFNPELPSLTPRGELVLKVERIGH